MPKIETLLAIQPLSQSRYEQMSCPEFYAETQVRGVTMPDNLHSNRGTEIHRAMAQYIDHCLRNRVAADWSAFDHFASSAGREAGAILDGIRQGYRVDFEHVALIEQRLCLDEDLQPIKIAGDIIPAAYEGTPDVVLLLDETRAKIEDFKSHPRPFDADTFQSVLYPFLVMQHFPLIESVEFELIFVRYANARRSVTWTRAQMPEMMRQVERARARQMCLHRFVLATDHPVEARPGNHCQYCVHLSRGTCPVREQNPHATMTVQDRVLYAEWLRQQEKLNTAVLKEYVDAHGPVTAVDANGKAIEASYQPCESAWYPLGPTVALLEEWRQVDPADNPFDWKDLRVGSTQLKSKLKAKKRASLDQRMQDEVIVRTTDVSFKLTRANDGEEEEEPAYQK